MHRRLCGMSRFYKCTGPKKCPNCDFTFNWSIHWIYWNQIHKTKSIKTHFFKITFNSCIDFKKENFLFSFCFLVPPVKVYKKVVKFSFTQQKIFWVLVFSFMYLVSVDPMDRSFIQIFKKFPSFKFYPDFIQILSGLDWDEIWIKGHERAGL